ncbi:fucose mutarotase isoform X2 [Callorhinus ursinus]|uniref:L-fucose mutarotase n=1 Tax=Callorhinus ursinus TaxID=34884 RepID=A0A3Q7PQ10_CALUR|nr:fucose mutarotase-like isoform X2 [Callorhinus ursinus]XP_025735991.1 fucose mutarotase-like isoform X2 [Callorhinus ursinus]
MVVLKGVPALLSPELLYALARMGHGDEIGLGIPLLLEAVLKVLPLDTYVESPAAVMELVPSDRRTGLQTPVWRSYQSILFEAGCTSTLAKIERFEFYARAKKAFAVVATGETALYGNLILKKGVLAPEALF